MEESNAADKLKNLVAVGNAKFHGFDEAHKWLGVKSCSWNEKKVEKMVKKASANDSEYKDLLAFTKKHLLRCYRAVCESYQTTPIRTPRGPLVPP